MSKKKDRAWYVCPQWPDLISRHYDSDAEAAQNLKTDAKVLAKLRAGTPVAKSSLRRVLTRYASRHPLDSPTGDLIIDTRTR
jgi:hypothetical protein